MAGEEESWETVDVAALTLSTPPPRPTSLEAAIAAATQQRAAPDAAVDAELHKALRGGGDDRAAVLLLDQQCEELLLARGRACAEVPPPLSAFQRLLARKVAAHYGLACDPGRDGGGVTLRKTADTRLPPARLSDVAAAPPAEAPRVLGVMRRASTLTASEARSSPAGSSSVGTGLSLEEREAEYERVRLRILGAGEGAGVASDETEGGAGGGGSEEAGKAVMRDREKDATDPDFRRPPAPGLYGPPPGAFPGAYAWGGRPPWEGPLGGGFPPQGQPPCGWGDSRLLPPGYGPPPAGYGRGRGPGPHWGPH